MRIHRCVMGIVVSLLLASCISDEHVYAPVTEIETIDPIPKSGTHRVVTGETLYSIAWRYGLDYRVLAKRNHLSTSSSLQTRRVIYLNRYASYVTKSATKINQTAHKTKESFIVSGKWLWPARGNVIRVFSDFNKGINIAGNRGDPIFATASGKVVYCGDGLRSYGKLIILKHDDRFLTAYAHNNYVYVKEGDIVRSGQKIAEMGNTGTQRVMLHFEIRLDGNPVNPLAYLSK